MTLITFVSGICLATSIQSRRPRIQEKLFVSSTGMEGAGLVSAADRNPGA